MLLYVAAVITFLQILYGTVGAFFGLGVECPLPMCAFHGTMTLDSDTTNTAVLALVALQVGSEVCLEFTFVTAEPLLGPFLM